MFCIKRIHSSAFAAVYFTDVIFVNIKAAKVHKKEHR